MASERRSPCTKMRRRALARTAVPARWRTQMFTLEISGKPVAVTNASEDEARELFESGAFKDDLMTLESEGAPLWDGYASLNIRPATQDETAAFENAATDEDGEADGLDDEPGPMLMFLVDVTDPDDRNES